jgi:hypothetical protein
VSYHTFTIVHFSTLPQECLRRLPISVYGFHFSGVGFRFQHAESLHATNPSAATKVMPPLEGRLLCLRLLSSILAFRCSRVVINGTRSAMGFALFLLERRKKYLLLYLGSGPALFWATGGKICLVYNCDTTKYPDIGDTIRMRKKNILEKRHRSHRKRQIKLHFTW